jgi:hypothetical protein
MIHASINMQIGKVTKVEARWNAQEQLHSIAIKTSSRRDAHIGHTITFSMTGPQLEDFVHKISAAAKRSLDAEAREAAVA